MAPLAPREKLDNVTFYFKTTSAFFRVCKLVAKDIFLALCPGVTLPPESRALAVAA